MKQPSEVFIGEESLASLLRKHLDWLYPEDEDEAKACNRLVLNREELDGIDFSQHNLARVVLTECSLQGCNFYEACLIGANLSNSDFYYANLHAANLRNADLTNACLKSANLAGATLDGACLLDVEVNEYTTGFHLVCPEEGSFIAWKKCRAPATSNRMRFGEQLIVKLEIPADAKRSSATTRKCRAAYAKVLEIPSHPCPR